MATESTSWTAAQCYAQTRGLPRVSNALTEVVRRVKASLPGLIDYENAIRAGVSGALPFVKPADYLVAPDIITDAHLNRVLVSISAGKQSRGMLWENDCTLQIHLIEAKVGTDGAQQRAFDRSDLIAKILVQFKGGCNGAGGRVAWTSLIFQEQSVLPVTVSNQDYTGATLTYRLTQSPVDSTAHFYWESA